jgi:hypothetical protein
VHAPGFQAYVNLVWAVADVVILYTFFRYGRAELPAFVTRPAFIAWGMCSVFDPTYVALLLWAGTNPPRLVASDGPSD